MADYTDEQYEAIDALVLESQQRLLTFMDQQGIQARPSVWDALDEEIDSLFRAFLQRPEEIMAEKKEG